ncbi:MAG: VOC family protein [Saprospiraceae bacterium]|nr:VOC family protein [Saprospiraceae bacterium]
MDERMKQNIARICLLVRDYNEAIDFYTLKLDFDLLEDTDLGNGKRWVVVRPKKSNDAALLLAKAGNDRESKCIGNQTGGRVFMFLYTDDFYRDYNFYKEHGIVFHGEPRKEVYGTVAVFEDLYGNKWDLLEPSL